MSKSYKKGEEETHRGHTTHVLALAISSDGAFLASGCRSRVIHVWDPASAALLHTFRGHRGAVSVSVCPCWPHLPPGGGEEE